MAKVKKKILKKVIVKKIKKHTAKKVAPIPKGYHAITPYLIVDGGMRAIAFYKKAFGAKAVICMQHDGKIGHAELTIGDSKIMLSDGCSTMKTPNPKDLGGSPVSMHLYVHNVDVVVKRAVAAGAKLIRPVDNQFYGDRSGGVEDPFGHHWYIATHIEDLTIAQIKKRATALYGNEKKK